MLDYAALSALAAVIREGSFERAARALNVTPSAISQRIRLLEERVGCALVVRAQPCRATETGRRLCQHVDRVRLLEQELQGALPALAPEGVTRVALPVAVNADSLATWAAPAIATFAAAHPVLMEVAVDDQDHTTEWLRSGAVLAAVTGTGRPAAGCNSRPLGAMRYLAAASPAFMQRYFVDGVGAGTLAEAPSLVFNTKDELQVRWARRLCHRHVELPRHTLPSSQAFVTAALAGMGWGLHPQALVAPYLANGTLVELVPGAPLDVPLHWQYARAASGLLDGLSREVLAAARVALLAP
ncbi:LysR family transcriptional regulator, chromosome initiation inhibitor [Cupriavidus metallidurans]|jgi:LysR family transcriptional regulator (chromosome initiation inhibitor)|uniref:Chromosome initiation inhibitor n=2 Tax=Pseudomonadota TaxID=1224 RepID=Q1LGJ5_CUPMC|nr:LysR family transcriptional regulator ArgP [Cupriavidus metallidurans]ABF10731.1 putative chromosome initiation inhibitor [Cupriavidus metallidurans CH34]AVA35067.1 LysR family transcriptional regulator ArgP [Cupriavidus metallidurans]KWW34212.1 putative HTH-type transcriptional regulator [Cupriavidus metallidurans]MDE4921345.1 LysR family transcriptional regulator ArgP [Cupriavidus metallidurans]QGS31804.1 ArgP/LysG family DNA-binding transcriptional regulator [Cupriavidus metallidurans]